MTNDTEKKRWLKDAEAHLNRAKKLFIQKDIQGTVENAQLALELSVKATISVFGEPIWKHDPEKQLIEIVNVNKEKIIEKLGKEILTELKQIAEFVKIAAPWHGWSVYGKKDKSGWITGVDLCTEEIAKDLLEKAERAFTAAIRFTQMTHE